MTIGITGGIGSGKSILAKVLEAMGYPVFYSDAVAKDIMHSDAQLKSEIISRFGNESYNTEGLNRSFIAAKIFNNPTDKDVLNELVHPKVRVKFAEFVTLHASSYVFNEAAILFETGAYRNFDRTILVTAPIELRIRRVMLRDKCSRQEVETRMRNQWDDNQKSALANFTIVNDDEQPVLAQVEVILAELTA